MDQQSLYSKQAFTYTLLSSLLFTKFELYNFPNAPLRKGSSQNFASNIQGIFNANQLTSIFSEIFRKPMISGEIEVN